MPFGFYDPTFILLIPVIVIALWAQMRVSTVFNKYNKIPSIRRITGAKVAESLLNRNGIYDVKIQPIEGKLSDHYDPRTKRVRLSEGNYHGHSISALAVSAHEVGHAIQHHNRYVPLKLRHSILPATNIGSWAAFPLFFIGFFFNTPMLMDIGIILFSAVVVFHFVTLPVEFNASQTALAQLAANGMLVEQEVKGARKVLNVAALTYVAATAVALIHLIRLIIIRGDD